MRILIVCSINSGRIAPFILEQVQSLKNWGYIIDYFTIEGKGIGGYLSNRKKMIKKIKEFNPDLIHAHYGLSGLLANLQRKVPVITTYHGSDINNRKILCFSKMSIFLSKYNIFVSQKNINIACPRRKFALIPCGIDLQIFRPLDKNDCRKKRGFREDEKVILFAGTFANKVKNFELAQKSMKLLPGVRLVELKGYDRNQVCELMNAVDAVLMTSFTEGSPQFIKEAMACNCPIVSVDVGDVKDVISGIENCFITPYSSEIIAKCLRSIISSGKRTIARDKINRFDNELIAGKIVEIYNEVLL